MYSLTIVSDTDVTETEDQHCILCSLQISSHIEDVLYWNS